MTPEDKLTDWRQREAARATVAHAIRQENKARLLAAVAAAGLARVVVAFDGAGDSGQIEGVAAITAANEPRDLPPVTVEVTRFADWQTTATTTEPRPVEDALTDLAWDLLGAAHGGWENNDGGFGEIAFDFAAGEITLAMNGRFTDHITHQTTF